MRLWVYLVLVTAMLSGCKRADDPMTEDEFCRVKAKIECEEVAPQCGFNPMACEPVRGTACRDLANSSKSAMRMYVPANAPDCLDEVARVYGKKSLIPPADLARLDDACARVFQGMAKSGEMCKVDFDCAGSLVCDKERCANRKQVGSGEGCSDPGEYCPAGEHCKKANSFSMCVKRVGRGSACSEAEPCLEGFRCQGTCVDKLALGATCAHSAECGSDYCNPYGRICGAGLNFAFESASCRAYMGALSTDGSAVADSGPSPDSGPAADVGAGPDAGAAVF